MGLWIIDSHDSFKTRIHSETKRRCVAQMHSSSAVVLGNVFIVKIEQKHNIV